jgi:hypothetical protein
MLGTDTVALYPPNAASDDHGWALPGGAVPYWTGPGNLQLTPGPSDPRAADGGGYGPYNPAAALQGQLYLPPDCPLQEGSAAVIRGEVFAVSRARLVTDPTAPPGSGASCWVAAVAGTVSWQPVAAPLGGDRAPA